MRIGQAFKLAWKSILSSKMRSFLTMLGMIIGVWSVITLLGLMQGATNYLISTFSELGTNMVSVTVTNTDTRKVTADDMFEFVKDYSDIFTGMSPEVSSRYKVKYSDTSVTTSVKGVSEDYTELKSLGLTSGRFITYADIKNRYNGCVIGTYINKELFSYNARLGDTIRINGQVYTIVGILEKQDDSTASSGDDVVYIPYTNACRMSFSTDISNYTLAAKDSDTVTRAEKILDTFLYSKMKNEKLYTVSSATKLLDTINSITGVLSGILGGIAGISLLVAGIGIMNIMLVSVVERTKEIGIRKSLGAKKSDIMWQFVIEAASISTIGGIIGIVSGCVTTRVLGNAFGVEASPTVGNIILAFSVSAAIGIGFGYMPANKAAKLNPIDALRTE